MPNIRNVLHWKEGRLALDSCRVMGILNVTPDSFSDGGDYYSAKDAVARAWQIADEGAAILDVGAESTRPGARDIDESEERKRIWPVLELLAEKNYPLPISLDSSKPNLVREAIENNLVQIVNDVCGLRDHKMIEVVRDTKAPVIIMHMFGLPRTMQSDFHYEDVVRDLISFFRMRLDETGLTENVVLDPGIGFGKSVEHNLQILHRLKEFQELGFPLLIGASRKTFIRKLLDVDVKDTLEGSLTAAALAAYNGASIIRAHDVKSTVRAVTLVNRTRSSSS